MPHFPAFPQGILGYDRERCGGDISDGCARGEIRGGCISLLRNDEGKNDFVGNTGDGYYLLWGIMRDRVIVVRDWLGDVRELEMRDGGRDRWIHSSLLGVFGGKGDSCV